MTDLLTAGLACVVAFEPFLILFVGPRITRRKVEKDATRIFEKLMLPSIEAAQRRVADDLAARVQPPAIDVVAAVRTALNAAQAEAMERAKGQPSPLDAFRAAMRDELTAFGDAFVAKLDSSPASVSDAASAMSSRGVEARLDYAAREELFRSAIQQNGGAPALLLLDELSRDKPKVYKAYANKGAPGAAMLAKEAAALGIKLPGAQQTAASVALL